MQEADFYRLLKDGHPESGMSSSDMIAAAAFTTDDHTELNHTFYATADESILSGVWECAPCRVQIDAYPVHEMMTVISGSVTLSRDERSETFTAGDTFFIARGTPCIWEVTETLRKFYMIAA
jgi:uncharacterized cupin superfamily protein